MKPAPFALTLFAILAAGTLGWNGAASPLRAADRFVAIGLKQTASDAPAATDEPAAPQQRGNHEPARMTADDAGGSPSNVLERLAVDESAGQGAAGSRDVSNRDASHRDAAAWPVAGWAAYQQLWDAFARDPDNRDLRRYLGLPIGSSRASAVVVQETRGRGAPRWLGWQSGSYRRVETPHLQIFSRADPEETREVAEDLERVYWVWTQLFFPLWESRHQVAVQLGTRAPGQDVVQHLAGQSSRLATRRKLRVVLLRDAQDYARTLGRSVPGIEQSTGFYSDERRTSFFYPAPGADAVASRRHELVHQLFREATDSRLRGDSPGMASGFWLVEGIAGYFESLAFKAGRVTVGGWDSPRLQFTRHRVFGRREVVAFADLASGGRDEVQRRGDLARFYTFAIGYTHLLMDGDSLAARRWVYARLAELYDIEVEIPDAETPESIERALVDFLRVDDEHLSDHPSSRPLRQLCLAGCQVSGRGLAALARAPRLQWLDLSGLPVDGEDLRRLVPQPTALRQLSLEATRVDDSLADWIGAARELEEVDLSATACGDATVARLAELPALRTLWLTGSAVTDVCVPRIDQMDALRTLDLQDTAISAAALARLKVKHPSWNINPL